MSDRNRAYERADALHAEVERLRRAEALRRRGPCVDCAEPPIDGSTRCLVCHERYWNRWHRQPWWVWACFLTWLLATLIEIFR